jgi:hypothetical protein
MLRTIMEIRARPISLTAMPRRALGVISSRVRWKDHFPSLLFLSQTSVGKNWVYIAFLLVSIFFWFDRWPLLRFDDDENGNGLKRLGARPSSI